MNKSKRGRKPKSNIVINSSPIFDNNNDQNIILKIKKPKDKIKYENLELNDNTEYISNKYNCKHCGKNIESNSIGLPIKYNNNCFNTIYDFCNFNCINEYLNNNNINEYYEIYSLLELYKIMLKSKLYPMIKQVEYNNQIENSTNINIKKYKLQRKQKNNINFFNIVQ